MDTTFSTDLSSLAGSFLQLDSVPTLSAAPKPQSAAALPLPNPVPGPLSDAFASAAKDFAKGLGDFSGGLPPTLSNALPAFRQNPALAAAPAAARPQTAAATPGANLSVNPKDPDFVCQTTSTDCGAAAVTTLVREDDKDPNQSTQQVINSLDHRFAKGDGATPKELSDMLAHEGFQITRGASRLDQMALDDALAKGDKVVALVDSNTIRPGGATSHGSLHWVVVNGQDKNGQYQIKDPADGASYAVSRQTLADSMSNGWSQHQGGGMLVVHNIGAAATPQTESARAEANGQFCGVLGVNGGIGSNVVKYNTVEL